VKEHGGDITANNSPDGGAGIDRLAGYRDAITESGGPADPELVAVADFSQEGGATAMRALLKRRPDVDAVFAASDLMAVGAIAGGYSGAGFARRLGRSAVRRIVITIGFGMSLSLFVKFLKNS